jgi:hypothetical protein
MTDLDLQLVPEVLHAEARDCFERGDADGFYYAIVREACGGSPDNAIAIVRVNIDPLIGRGIYERVLLFAFTGASSNNRNEPLETLAELFRRADRQKFREAGDPFPGEGPFTIYRGIAGTGPAERVDGFSWSGSLDFACWFARRFKLENPEIYSAVVQAHEILAYYDGRDEKEFICRPTHVVKVAITEDEIVRRGEAFESALKEQDRQFRGE